jgi:hypothetical protein
MTVLSSYVLERRDRNPVQLNIKSKDDNAKPQTLDECLATFNDWPSFAPLSPEALAQTGFYYLGKNLHVKCFICDLEVADWRHGMTALGTHRKRRNTCQLILAIDNTGKGDLEVANEKWRLETLLGLALTTKNIQDTEQPDIDKRLCRELAACGFYRHKNSNIIRCAFCGVIIEPKSGRSIMSQHRQLTRQSGKQKTITINNHQQKMHVDCVMVRAQCPINIVIPDRERFPEYVQYRSIFDRIKSFDTCKQKCKLSDKLVRDMADAGFFIDGTPAVDMTYMYS